jgi:lambda repressor-like predicted transcriptional regulator
VSAELVKAAMNAAGVDVDMLADRIQVDVRTVRRWVNGSIPYARHQNRIARTLGTTARELWPEAHPDPADVDPEAAGGDEASGGARDSLAAFGSGDVVAVYHGCDDPHLPDARDLLTGAQTRIDLLDVTLADVITGRDIVARIAEKAAAGCEIRILISDPDSAHLMTVALEVHPELLISHRPGLSWAVQRTIGCLQPLLGLEHVDVRTYVAERVNSILRVDDEMLVTVALWGTPVDIQPVLHLRRFDRNGVFDRFAYQYDLIWSHAVTSLTADPETYPDPEEHPGRYQPGDPAQNTSRPAGFTRQSAVTRTPPIAPSPRWRRPR